MVQDHEQGRHRVRLRQPDPGNLPRRGEGGRRARWSPPAAATIPNQINNVLAFPGIFRGAFDVRASDINEAMKIAAAHALAGLISDDELNERVHHPRCRSIPASRKPCPRPSAQAARDTGVARI